MKPPVILWLRRDLRLGDNPGLAAALSRSAPVIPVFPIDEPTARPLGSAAAWWRGRSLVALRNALRRRGSDLVIRRGPPAEVLAALGQETGAHCLVFNESYEPDEIAIEAAVGRALPGIEIVATPGNRLHQPWSLKTGAGDPYRVFTPFWRRFSEAYRAPTALVAPERLPAPKTWPQGIPAESVLVKAGWSADFDLDWEPGEDGAHARLEAFAGKAEAYGEGRDRPDIEATARLSPHLAWGEISPHAIWRRLDGPDHEHAGFLRQLGWRDFNTHLLYHFAELPRRPWNRRFANFPWRDDPAGLQAWRRGQTGYPIVDAGMRQLWHTGWMHNRIRMVAASFLIKDLLIYWRLGEARFWDTLVDADLAQNTGNWQWVAGSGADAAPYFRIFNPVTQSRKFDPDGAYIRRWVPELAALPDKLIHEPWAAAPLELAEYGVTLGKTYPASIVDHAEARIRALAAYGKGSP